MEDEAEPVEGPSVMSTVGAVGLDARPTTGGTERAPAKQARSRRTRQRLIAAGRELIEHQDFDDTGIAQFASMADVSVGAFYHHFRDKDDYYAAIVETITDSMWQRFEAEFHGRDLASLDTPTMVRHAVQFIRDVVIDSQGLMRTALKKSMQDPAAWEPIRGFARSYSQHLHTLLSARSDDITYRPLDLGIRRGMQMLYSTLFNAVINRPEPMAIEDPQIVDELTHMMIAYLGVRTDNAG